jgi:hypothetical protein
MLAFTAKNGSLRCVEATSVVCPLCRQELHNIYRDIDCELSRMVMCPNWSARKSLLEEGAKYSASIRQGDYPNDYHLGMIALHFAVRDAAPTEIIKEIYYPSPIALFSLHDYGMTPLDFLNGLSGYELENFGWTVERATEVKEFLKAQLPAGVRE